MPAVFVWRPARLERDGAWDLPVQTGSPEAFRYTVHIGSRNLFVPDLAERIFAGCAQIYEGYMERTLINLCAAGSAAQVDVREIPIGCHILKGGYKCQN